MLHAKGDVWHRTICNDDFQRNAAFQCLNNIVSIQNNVATMLQGCVALKIVVADHVQVHVHLFTLIQLKYNNNKEKKEEL